MQLLRDRVLLSRLSAKTEQGGIILPPKSVIANDEAVVEYVGLGYKYNDGTHKPLEVKVGDVVKIGRYAGVELKIDDQDYVIVQEKEILCIIDRVDNAEISSTES